MWILLQRAQSKPMVEMNITPLIDVMLVLIVMFIITIPLQTHAVKLELPGPAPLGDVRPVKNEIGITRTGDLLWNGQPITRDALKRDIQAAQQMRPTPELHLRPDPEARYEAVDQVLAMIKREHVRKFGFVGNEAYRNW